MSGRWVALVPIEAVRHLGEVVLQQLALAELEAGNAEAVHWPAVRDRSLAVIQAQAALGDERAEGTWAALVTAGYDAEFCHVVNGLEAGLGDQEGPT